ncbi:DUF805 domain-containing protein [Aquimarina hainanensis]|uniref:DUF805 domain-containing protein n=1 Tax=Aquimarina hainanensis TaxID=1578017 RepID=A0ABW5N331_9FLAO|nr:DUF805 domain-containing protein [Aquimarina sp. TRL1]
MNWYITALNKYAEFNGRARRKEYWFFALFNLLFAIVAIILDNVLGIAIREIGYGPLYGIYALATIIPGLAVAVRRLHDIGKSGWMILIAFIPFIGAIWLLILFTTDSDPGENEYGPNPKQFEDIAPIEEQSSNGDLILILVVSWMLFSRTFYTFLPKIIDNFYSLGWFKPLSTLMGLVWSCIPLALGFIVKDKTKQLLVFILGGVYILLELYSLITQFLF